MLPQTGSHSRLGFDRLAILVTNGTGCAGKKLEKAERLASTDQPMLAGWIVAVDTLPQHLTDGLDLLQKGAALLRCRIPDVEIFDAQDLCCCLVRGGATPAALPFPKRIECDMGGAAQFAQLGICHRTEGLVGVRICPDASIAFRVAGTKIHLADLVGTVEYGAIDECRRVPAVWARRRRRWE